MFCFCLCLYLFVFLSFFVSFFVTLFLFQQFATLHVPTEEYAKQRQTCVTVRTAGKGLIVKQVKDCYACAAFYGLLYPTVSL